MSDEEKSLDVLGIKGLSDSVKTLTEGLVAAASAFLGRICLPVAEELGLLMRDRVRYWRTLNIVSIVEHAEKKLGPAEHGNVEAHPRLVFRILEEGSWCEDSEVQKMWGGLLAASCTERHADDSNLMFVDLLSKLTKLQARLLDHACRTCNKEVGSGGLIWTRHNSVSIGDLRRITGEDDVDRLDREMDYLRSLGLMQKGFDVDSIAHVDIAPTPLALHLYTRCHGASRSPLEFFGLTQEQDEHSSKDRDPQPEPPADGKDGVAEG